MTYIFRRCTVTEFRKNMGAILDAVEAGATYEVTRYGKPCVYILPIPLYERMQEKT